MGEIVEVEGGHIVRSKGRKDRHSKVCTAKGPRDRRVRLSAHTAIQFYDVQDRLGCDRPSKALDWLINKAKSAIDQLAQLPPWKPTQQQLQQQRQNDDVLERQNSNSNSNPKAKPNPNPNLEGLGFVSSENEIADTIRSLFPGTTSFSPIQFHQHVLFTDGTVAWNGAATDTGSNNDGGEFVFNAPSPLPSPSPSQLPLPSMVFGQSQYLSSQRGPLQSSNNDPNVRAWIDAPSLVAADHRLQSLSPAAMVLQSSPVTGFASGGFSGFRVPARIQGDEEEEHGGVYDKLSSASSYYRR